MRILLALSLAMAALGAAELSTIEPGTNISVRTNERIGVKKSDGRIYTGVVEQEVLDRDGRVAIPRGSSAELTVRNTGHELTIDLESVTVNGQRFAVAADQSQVGTG